MKKRSLRRKAPLWLLSAILVCAAAGCTGSTASDAGGDKNVHSGDGDKHVTLLMHFKSATFDPHNDFIPLRAGVTETLTKLDENLRLQGWLASQWEAKGEKTWVFTIRDGVTFHDGTKVDAAAVKASFERAIAASKPLAAGLKIASMEADGQTFTVHTTEPHPALPSEIVSPYASIVNAEAEKSVGKEAFNSAPVGTGPFKVRQFTPNIEAQLERYDGYWAGQPKLQTATVRFNEDANVRAIALQSQEADIVYNIPAESIPSIERNERLKIESVSGLRVHFLLYNQQKPMMQDLKVRTALNLLLNRESVAGDIALGHAAPANGPFNDKLPFGIKEPAQKQDLAKAKALLAEAGYEPGESGKMYKDGAPLELELITYKARPELPLIAQLVQSDAAKAGVTVNIRSVENADTYLAQNKDWDMATYSNLSAPRGDGGFFLNSAYLPGGALNHGKINIPRLTEIVTQLNRTSDSAQRIQLTQKAVAVVNEEIPHSYAVYPNLIVGVNERVINWMPGREEFYILTHTMDVK
ncbi:nickel ABC transporter substrate-binding protein [Paenibacillus xerothermodurans]|uniref:ABC transporter substrate-binding protein n=1 Tax=Paenibacillus xerothermodurans TaxID=1977292 RepID=A0A2W1NCF4_PAEXE|nr:nickel ABC transporter substrate-binding protein [Paenibacillus xerothermodurans]PZE20741.1 ABC transporter substrate-binding protein [Paenibacillus xerothermodurans]